VLLNGLTIWLHSEKRTEPLTGTDARELLEVIDDRYERRSTVVCSQLPLSEWHRAITDPTLADAILDRLVHGAHKFTFTGESMRKKKGGKEAKEPGEEATL
jgi:DNA replication protein DnaC